MNIRTTRWLKYCLLALSAWATAACDSDIFGPDFGPDTPTARSILRGVVTSADDGSPVPGARVYPVHSGFVSYSGAGITADTAFTDANGRYLLDTQHFCPSQLVVVADSFARSSTGSILTCPGRTDTLTVDIELPPTAWAQAAYDPAWSPGGGEIAVSLSNFGGGPLSFDYDLVVFDTLGSSDRVTDGYAASAPSWSPDGSKIGHVGPESSITIVGRDGSGAVTYATGQQLVSGISWSPLADTIAFWTLSGSSETHIYLLDLGTSAVTQLTQPGSSNSSLSWSPDGTEAVFASNRGGTYQIYRMNADGSDVTRISDAPGGARRPAWSPCGDRLAYTTNSSAGPILETMALDGSDVVRVTEDAESPTWSPDCTRLAYTSGRAAQVDGATHLWVIDTDGSNARQLSGLD